MVIAIDGPAGSGKSTLAQMIATRLGFTYINSGSLYRAITLACIRSNVDPTNPETALNTAKKIEIDYQAGRLILDGEDVEDLLHSDAVDASVAQLSAIVLIRHIVNDYIRKIAQDKNAVVEGRDMTTVVFPHAEIKFFLDASADARAGRRHGQGVSNLSLEEIKRGIEKRDTIDRNKAEGSLIVAPDAVYLDTSDLTIERVYAKLVEKIQTQGSIMGQMEVGMDATKKSADSIQTQLQEEYLKSLEQLEEGQLVDGIVIQVT
ncbi:MAG: (d)CMP kinase, partial [Treponemataceae bacterium]